MEFINLLFKFRYLVFIIYEMQVKVRYFSDKRIYVSFFKHTPKHICVCCCTFRAHGPVFDLLVFCLLKRKLFSVKTKRKNIKIILVPIFFFHGCFPSFNSLLVWNICIERTYIDGYKDAVARKFFHAVNFRIKTEDSLVYELCSFTCDCNWLSKYSEILIAW